MAIRWLDAARYADTNGYQSDGERVMWRWRDWVIDSFNANLPYDRFTIEQLAGDLLPGASAEQVIASGFNRNHRGNAEGGIIPEEYAVEYVADRVETTATVWLGLTMTCCRCHDHKYDPLTQKEFYQVFAFFNNVPERGKAVKYGNSPPVMLSPTRRQQERLQALDRELAAAGAKVRSLAGRLRKLQSQWEKSLKSGFAALPLSDEGLAAHFPLNGAEDKAKFVDGPPAFASGKVGRAAELDGKRHLDAGDVGAFGFLDRFSLAAWVYPRGKPSGTIVSRMQDESRGEGYSVVLNAGRLQILLVKRYLDDAIRVETEQPLTGDGWHHVVATYDGSRIAAGVKVFIDGQEVKLRVLLDDLNQTFLTRAPFRIGAGGGSASRFVGRIADVRIYSRTLSAGQAAGAGHGRNGGDDRQAAHRETHARPGAKAACVLSGSRSAGGHSRGVSSSGRAARETAAHAERHSDDDGDARVARPRNTHILVRGQYDRPGPRVAPECRPPWPRGRGDRSSIGWASRAGWSIRKTH